MIKELALAFIAVSGLALICCILDDVPDWLMKMLLVAQIIFGFGTIIAMIWSIPT